MEFTVTKDKNLISFLGEGKSKPYVFDVNTGILYSMRSQPLKNLPSTLQGYLNRHNEDNPILFLMRKMVDNVYSFGATWSFRCNIYTTNANLFVIADKLNSIGYTIKPSDYSSFYSEPLKTIDDNFKEFAKYYAETENASIHSFISDMMPTLWAKKHGIEINEVFTLDFVNRIQRENYTETQIKYIVNAVRRGALYFYMDNRGNFCYWDFLNDFGEYFRICDTLELKYEKDFFRGMINARRTYITYKKEFSAKAIQKNYEKHNFNFETDDFIVVIPQTADDFKNEAEQQRNCVYSCYLDAVINGDTNVVFIRKKDSPEKSFITCEISHNGQIRQYLYRHNQGVYDNDSKEYQFRLDYQKWLNENWE